MMALLLAVVVIASWCLGQQSIQPEWINKEWLENIPVLLAVATIMFLIWHIVFFAPFKRWEASQAEIGKLQKHLDSASNREANLYQLAAIREGGTVLWHEAEMFVKEAEVPEWIDRVKTWHQEAVNAIERLSPADAKYFQTLRAWNPPFMLKEPLSAEHDRYYVMIQGWLERIEGIYLKGPNPRKQR